jgi:branched-chain amino acid transport system substrate-binding protein
LDGKKLKIHKNLTNCFSIIFLLTVALVIFAEEYRRNEDIIIGFSGQLTGSQAELGVQQRNGALLAVEQVNEAGGVAGRKISLIISDDCGIPEEAQFRDNKAIKDGAIAIIGHTTTTQTLEGLKVTNPANVVMIAPTVSTPDLSGLDDYFLRVTSSLKNSAQTFAKHIYEEDKITSIYMIYDRDNLGYCEAYIKTFKDEFQALGGKIIDKVSFSSRNHPDFNSLLSDLNKSDAQGLFVVASDIDTALISQRTRLVDKKIPIFTSAWAQTETLISNGGHQVEGMEIEQAYNLNSQSSAFINFKSSYKARFGNEPSFGAAYSYEATSVLIEALKKTHGNKNKLKEALLETKNFTGLTDSFSFDKYGDVERPWYLGTIHNGKL